MLTHLYILYIRVLAYKHYKASKQKQSIIKMSR